MGGGGGRDFKIIMSAAIAIRKSRIPSIMIIFLTVEFKNKGWIFTGFRVKIFISSFLLSKTV